MRVGAHAPLALGGQRGDLRPKRAVVVEQLLRAVALHPAFEQLDVIGPALHLGERHLVRAPEALGLVPVHLLRPGPAFGALQNDHRPDWPPLRFPLSGVLLNGADVVEHLVEGGGHLLMHLGRVVALDQMRLVAVTDEQAV